MYFVSSPFTNEIDDNGVIISQIYTIKFKKI